MSLTWRAPSELALGRLGTVDLVETDPAAPAPPRPGEDRLGPLLVRGVEPLTDARGWRLTVEPLVPGLAVVRPMDLGEGRLTPELRIRIPRTVPFGAPWVGVGGGQEDILPPVPTPWEWGALLALPLVVAATLAARARRRHAPERRRKAARRAFLACYPPGSGRAALDAAHGAGRQLLAEHFGASALGWGAADLRERGLEPWATWVLSLDAARFARTEPPFPEAARLLAALEGR